MLKVDSMLSRVLNKPPSRLLEYFVISWWAPFLTFPSGLLHPSSYFSVIPLQRTFKHALFVRVFAFYVFLPQSSFERVSLITNQFDSSFYSLALHGSYSASSSTHFAAWSFSLVWLLPSFIGEGHPKLFSSHHTSILKSCNYSDSCVASIHSLIECRKFSVWKIKS